jgi:hypothetical protein
MSISKLHIKPRRIALLCNGWTKSECFSWHYKNTDNINRQTQGKTFPYLFSQCQPIYARTLVPLQGMLGPFFGLPHHADDCCKIPPQLRSCVFHVCVILYIIMVISTQKYSAKVTSVLPVLLSALRISPPSGGPAHDGKVIGKDLVAYTYDQVCFIQSKSFAYVERNWTVSRFRSHRTSLPLRLETSGIALSLRSKTNNGRVGYGQSLN